MKKCKQCGTEHNDDSICFCPFCGGAVEPVSEMKEEQIIEESFAADVNSVEKKTKKAKKKLFLIIGIPVILIVLAAVAVYLSLFVFGKGPIGKISDAVVKTVESESFTVKFKADGETVNVKVALDFKKKDISLLIENDDTISGIYNGYGFTMYTSAGYDSDDDWVCSKKDISENIKMFFDEWEKSKKTSKNGEINWDEFFDMLEEMEADIDRDKVEEHINLDKTSLALKEAYKLLNDEEWLDECMGYEKNKDGKVTYYSFDVDFGNLSDTIDNLFEDCAESATAEFVIESAVKSLNKLDKNDAFVKTVIGTERGYLSEVEIKFGDESESDKIKIEFSEVGSTEFDEDKMQEYLDKCGEDDSDSGSGSVIGNSRDKLPNQYETKNYYFRQGYNDTWKINLQPTDGKLVPDYEDQNLALQLVPEGTTGVQYNVFCNWDKMSISMTDSAADIAEKVMNPDGEIYFNKANYIDTRYEYVQSSVSTPVTYNKMQWYQVEFTYIDKEGDQCQGVWNLHADGSDYYIVSYEAKADKYDMYYSQFEEMINDFKKIGFENN